MRIETVDVETVERAMEMCPWACRVIEVDDGNGGVAYKCYESVTDYETALRQN